MVLAVGIADVLWWLQKPKMAAYSIGIDLMGADVPPDHILEAATSLLPDFYSNVSLVFFATEEVQRPVGANFVVSPDVVRMDENPIHTLRERKKTSLAIGIHALKEGTIQALISCANTGALLALTRVYLETFSSITRPALMCEVKSQNGYVAILDVGANVEASNELLWQWAKLGASYLHTVRDVAMPKVALLNIGEEEIKGTQDLKSAYSYFSEHPSDGFNFIGNSEPYDVFTGQADVFITNGFSGNLFLKSCEAASRFTLEKVQHKYPDLSLLDMREEGHGALVLGLKQLVVKCHGKSSVKAIQQALIHTKTLLQEKALSKIEQSLGL